MLVICPLCVCLCAHRCSRVVQAAGGTPALHAAAGADSGERDEAECTHGLSDSQTGVEVWLVGCLMVFWKRS